MKKQWKTGQTCRVGRFWGTVTFLMSDDQVIVTLDDHRQVMVSLDSLADPVVDASGHLSR